MTYTTLLSCIPAVKMKEKSLIILILILSYFTSLNYIILFFPDLKHVAESNCEEPPHLKVAGDLVSETCRDAVEGDLVGGTRRDEMEGDLVGETCRVKMDGDLVGETCRDAVEGDLVF